MSFMRTALLLAALTALVLLAGLMLGGARGLMISGGLALALNAWAYWNSDRSVLRMHGAREVTAQTAPGLVAMVDTLAERADLPTPKVYVMDQDQPNAFATGRDANNAAVAVTTGLQRLLSTEELAGVVAHELAHIKNRDTLLMTLTATLAGTLSALANFALFFGGRRNLFVTLLLSILAPLAASLVQMTISRTREYAADRVGGQICGNPLWLAAALHKISHAARRHRSPSAEQNPASAHLFIINPLNGQGMDTLFSTHPNTTLRIRALEDQGRALGVSGRETWT